MVVLFHSCNYYSSVRDDMIIENVSCKIHWTHQRILGYYIWGIIHMMDLYPPPFCTLLLIFLNKKYESCNIIIFFFWYLKCAELNWAKSDKRFYFSHYINTYTLSSLAAHICTWVLPVAAYTGGINNLPCRKQWIVTLNVNVYLRNTFVYI